MTDETCPQCDEQYNHKVTNGYRNTWPSIEYAVFICTTADSETIYVHVDND